MDIPYEIIKEAEHSKDLGLFLDFLKADTEDRVLAIIASSYAEKYLGQLVQTAMPGLTKALTKSLFGPVGPIGPMKSRIDIAQAMGLISPEQGTALILLSEIRNKFAHELRIGSFGHEVIAQKLDRIDVFSLYQPPFSGDEKYRRMIGATRGRAKFCFIALQLCVALHNRVNSNFVAEQVAKAMNSKRPSANQESQP